MSHVGRIFDLRVGFRPFKWTSLKLETQFLVISCQILPYGVDIELAGGASLILKFGTSSCEEFQSALLNHPQASQPQGGDRNSVDIGSWQYSGWNIKRDVGIQCEMWNGFNPQHLQFIPDLPPWLKPGN